MLILLNNNDNDDDDDNDSNKDNEDNNCNKTCTASSHTGSFNTYFLPFSKVKILHCGLLTSDSWSASESMTPAHACEWNEKEDISSNTFKVSAHNQTFSSQPEAVCKNSTGLKIETSLPLCNLIILSDTEDELSTQFSPDSLTEKVSDCIYYVNNNGCQESRYNAVNALLKDDRWYHWSFTSQIPEHSQSLNATKIVQSMTSSTIKSISDGSDYVHWLLKEQQRQYAWLCSDTRLQHVIEVNQYGQKKDMLLFLHQESKKWWRSSLSLSSSSAAVENGPFKWHCFSKSASKLPSIDQNVHISQAPQEQKRNIFIICNCL